LSDKEGNFSIAPVTSGLVLEMLVKPGDHVGPALKSPGSSRSR
jgi:hypothetical protein